MKGDDLTESLRVHKPLASAFKILHKPSLGDTSRTTKFSGKEQPALARLSAHFNYWAQTWPYQHPIMLQPPFCSNLAKLDQAYSDIVETQPKKIHYLLHSKLPTTPTHHITTKTDITDLHGPRMRRYETFSISL